MGSLTSLRSCKTDPADIVAISRHLGDDGQKGKILHRVRSGATGVFSHQMTMKLNDVVKLARIAILGCYGDYWTPSVDYLARNQSFVAVNATLFIGLG